MPPYVAPTDINAISADVRFKAYLDHDKLLIESTRDASKTLDQNLLLLSSGAFGLSLLIAKQLLPTVHVNSLVFLVASWLLFWLTIVFTLLSLVSSQHELTTEARELSKVFYPPAGESNSSNQLVQLRSVTGYINALAMAMFITGSLVLVVFTFMNLLS